MRRFLALISLFFSVAGCVHAAAPTTKPSNLTFIVAGDSHFGAEGMEGLNRRMIQHINAIAGRPYPPSMGGQVGTPRGVLFMGDMTDWSQEDQWQVFARLYGLTGKEGMLSYPIFETVGNHDIAGPSPVPQHVKERHGGLNYSWDWEGIHFACLGMYPNAEALAWLKSDMEKAGPAKPLILFFHYSIQGPYSQWWTDEQKDAFAKAIGGYNVLAIFHGHFHRPGHYTWQGHEVFLPGSPRHAAHAFLVVRITQGKLAAATWDWDRGAWAGEPVIISIPK